MPEHCKTVTASIDYAFLAEKIKLWGHELGFRQVGIADTDLTEAENRLWHWLDDGMHGEMEYMSRHGAKRTHPDELIPGTVRVISVAMDYYPADSAPIDSILEDPDRAFISRYALGRDYHKLIRKRLEKLAQKITETVGEFGYRAFADSAPVMEKPLAQNAGLGWVGKHTNLISRKAGSWFFLGELYTDLPLPTDAPEAEHCGACSACISACPTNAIVAPYVVDARLCISYLTIELRGSIPIELRPLIGNRIFGCDDCQMVCPWNRFAADTQEPGFKKREYLDAPRLIDLFDWDEDKFLSLTEGSAIRRIGYEGWLRNIAVALGNAPKSKRTLRALHSRCDHDSPLVREHVAWAIEQQMKLSV